MFEKYGLHLESDFEIRLLREDENDVDIIIPIDNRTLNLSLDEMPRYISSRIQFPLIKNIIIRFSKLKDINTCTIHLLRSIDLQSSVTNFEINYAEQILMVKQMEYSVDFIISSNH